MNIEIEEQDNYLQEAIKTHNDNIEKGKGVYKEPVTRELELKEEMIRFNPIDIETFKLIEEPLRYVHSNNNNNNNNYNKSNYNNNNNNDNNSNKDNNDNKSNKKNKLNHNTNIVKPKLIYNNLLNKEDKNLDKNQTNIFTKNFINHEVSDLNKHSSSINAIVNEFLNITNKSLKVILKIYI